MATIVISSKLFKCPQLTIRDSSGQTIDFTVSRFKHCRQKKDLQNHSVVSSSAKFTALQIDRTRIAVRFKKFAKSPVFFISQFFKTWRIHIIDIQHSQLPLHIDVKDNPNPNVWVSRRAAMEGIAPCNLDNTLELDYQRAAPTFDLIIRETDIRCGTKFDMFSDNEYDLHKYIESPVAKLFFDEIKGATVVSGRIVTSESEIFPISNYLMGASVNFAGYTRKLDEPQRYQVINTKLVKPGLKSGIFIGYSPNWFHFFVECIPRLMEIPEHIRTNLPVILPDDAPRQVVEICEHLTKASVVKLNILQSIYVETLFMGCEQGVRETFEFHFRKTRLQEAVNRLRIDFDNSSKVDPSQKQSLFLQRPLKLFRPLQNETRIKNWLKDRNFRIISPEKMGLMDVFNQMNNAKLVIAESGAGITNILFAQSGTCLIELYPGRGPTTFWPELASISGVSVKKVMSRPMPFGPKGLATDGIFISIKKLKEAIDELDLEAMPI